MTRQPLDEGLGHYTIVALAATGNAQTLTTSHFGSAETYVLYRCNSQGCEKIRVVRNTTQEERHDGDPAKAASVRELLGQYHVDVLVARRFGPNISRIRRDFVPAITRATSVDESIADLLRSWLEIARQVEAVPERRNHVLLLQADSKQEDKGNVMIAKVDEQKCKGCARCVDVCPVDAIEMKNRVAVIDEGTCVSCGACVAECPVEAIMLAG